MNFSVCLCLMGNLCGFVVVVVEGEFIGYGVVSVHSLAFLEVVVQCRALWGKSV